MSAVLNVSEGFPTDGRIFQPPQINRDNEQPRFVTFEASLIDPETVTSCPWTKGGGIRISNPCLRVVKNFLRKGRITPVLRDTHDFLPYDLVKKTTDVSPLQAGYFAQPIPLGYTPPALPPANGQFQPGFGDVAVGGPSPYGNLVGKLALPGEQVNAIINGSEALTYTNVRRGVVEHRSLYGLDYNPNQRIHVPNVGTFDVDPEIWRIQTAIYPTFPNLPVLLDDMERLLDTAWNTHESLRPTIEEKREALTLFRDYANLEIQNTHHKMRESGGNRGYIFRYTAMDLVLLEQLGMARQDQAIRQQVSMGGNDSELRDMFTQFLKTQIEEKQARLDAEKRVGEVERFVPSESTMMAAPPLVDQSAEFENAGADTEIKVEPLEGYSGYEGQSGYSGFSGEITNATPEGQERMNVAMADTLTCGCGKVAGSLAGLKSHQRSCEKAKSE